MAQSTQQMTEWIRKGEPHKKIKQDIVVTTRTLENSSSWRLCTGCRRHRDVCSGVWFSVQNLLFVPHRHCFFFFNPEMYNDLSLEKCTFLCNLWAPGGLMNLCTYLCIANSIRSLFIFGIRKKSWNQEAQISSFPSLELKANGSGVVSHTATQHSLWKLLKHKMLLQDCVKGLGCSVSEQYSGR